MYTCNCINRVVHTHAHCTTIKNVCVYCIVVNMQELDLALLNDLAERVSECTFIRVNCHLCQLYVVKIHSLTVLGKRGSNATDSSQGESSCWCCMDEGSEFVTCVIIYSILHVHTIFPWILPEGAILCTFQAFFHLQCWLSGWQIIACALAGELEWWASFRKLF